jgi:uncharacterized DUF497 family protein
MASEFEWDKSKAESNLVKHSVSFQEASTVFNDFSAVFLEDKDHSDGEHREIIIGYSARNALLTVVFTERNGKTRIISGRKATSYERKVYENF